MATKKTIYFSENNLFDKISDILKKNGTEETVSSAAFLDKSFIIATARLIKDLIEGRISEKELIDSLQKQLSIDLKTAQNISKDVREQIFPFADNIEVTQRISNSIQPKTTEDLDIFPKAEPIVKEGNQEIPVPATKRIKKIPSLEKDTPAEQSKKQAESDTYREPIE